MCGPGFDGRSKGAGPPGAKWCVAALRRDATRRAGATGSRQADIKRAFVRQEPTPLSDTHGRRLGACVGRGVARSLNARMTTTGPDTPHIKAVDKSGFPFQLAVERELRALGRRFQWEVSREVPIGDRFADIVLRRPNLLAVVECKRVDGEHWHFLVPKGSSSNVPW